MSVRKSCGGIGVTAGLAALWLLVGSRAAPVGQPESVMPPTPVESEPHLRLVGTARCSAGACHGGMDPVQLPQGSDQTIGQNEYTTWIGRDRHANAYRVLFEERSQKIAAALKATDHEGKPLPAHQDRRCLACHTNPATLAIGPEAAALVQEEQAFGVGCEACHGSAGKWYGPHTVKGWSKQSAAEKVQDGMTPLGDVRSWAQQCTGCHVGAGPEEKTGLPVRDVNHDLIAAGHPRLNFEFAVFLANMPPHWNKARENQPSEAKSWAVGQAVSAHAALELLQYRARVDEEKPWPEFAEYSCFACHHDLAQPSWRQQLGYPGRKVGALPWNTWYFSVLPQALGTQAPQGDVVAFIANVQQLREEMQKPNPDRGQVQKLAGEMAQALDQWAISLDHGSYGPEVLQRSLLALAQGGEKTGLEGWDSMAQRYLGIAALNGHHGKQLQPALDELARALAFPSSGPDKTGRSRYDSPRGFEPNQGDAALAEIFKKLSQRNGP